MRKKFVTALLFVFAVQLTVSAQQDFTKHPGTSGDGWVSLFTGDLSDAVFPKGIWTISDGVITASEDEVIWTKQKYTDFILDLEFKNGDGANSGVIVHAGKMKKWIPHSVEIQVMDDYAEKWLTAPASWKCGAVFGHQAATQTTVKKAGEWNHFTVTCKDRKIWVVLNGVLVNELDMSLYTSAKTNPDGTEIPSWLSNPLSEIPLHGYIGLQGKHAGAPVYFRNVKIKVL